MNRKRIFPHLVLFLLMTLLVLAINLPQLWIKYFHIPADALYFGFSGETNDFITYLLKMERGQNGYWTYINRLTMESHRPVFLFTFYILLGHLARWFSVSLLAIFHLARLALSYLLLYRLFFFCSSLFPRRKYLSFLFSVLAGGMGWLQVLLGQECFFYDCWVPEGFVFSSLAQFPHFILAQFLLLDILAFFLSDNNSGINRLKLILELILLSLVYPFSVPVLGVILLIWQIIQWLQRTGTGLFRSMLKWGKYFLFPLPFLLYQYLLTFSHPVIRRWREQSIVLSGNPLNILMGYSPLLVLAFLGAAKIFNQKKTSSRLLFLAVWTVVGFLIVFLPFSFQRRLILGYSLPISLTSFYYLRSLPRSKFWGTIIIVFSLLSWGVNMQYWSAQPEYLSGGEQEILAWIKTNLSLESHILADVNSETHLAVYLPYFGGTYSYLGHWAESLDREEREKYLDLYFSQSMSLEEEKEFLQKNNLDYIYWLKSLPNNSALAEKSYLTMVYGKDDYCLAKINWEK